MAASTQDGATAAAGNYLVDEHDGGASDGEMEGDVEDEIHDLDADRRDGGADGDDNYSLLRNLLWATSKHDVYFLSNSKVGHRSSLPHSLSEVLDFSGHVAPAEKHPGSLLEGFSGVQGSTLAVNQGLLVAGGFQGELVCKGLADRDVKFCTRTTLSDECHRYTQID